MTRTQPYIENFSSEGHEALKARTQERKEKILEMIHDPQIRHELLKNCEVPREQRGIIREDVEQLLGVSENTALKYLNELEDEGTIEQMGIGQNTYYIGK